MNTNNLDALEKSYIKALAAVQRAENFEGPDLTADEFCILEQELHAARAALEKAVGENNA